MLSDKNITLMSKLKIFWSQQDSLTQRSETRAKPAEKPKKTVKNQTMKKPAAAKKALRIKPAARKPRAPMIGSAVF